MKDVYEQHKASFKQVAAYVLVDEKGDRVATIAFKYPKDGAGRVHCYLHILGMLMQRGHANGYGYDKSSAATMHAIAKVTDAHAKECGMEYTVNKIRKALDKADSGTWNRELENAGYSVYQAV